MRRRVGIFGWGVVAPRSPDVDAFAANLESGGSWLEPFHGFGPDNFLVGKPEFRFRDYQAWVDERFPPNRFPQLDEKMDHPTRYAIGAFVQALSQNPGLEEELTRLGPETHVYVGTGLGNISTWNDEGLRLHRAQRAWDWFWAQPERNAARAEWLALPAEERPRLAEMPEAPPPEEAGPPRPGYDPVRADADAAWDHYWATRSDGLERYLEELAEIEGLAVEGAVETGKMRLMKEKRRRFARLQAKWEAPEPPWGQVSANVLWNLHNTPAAQITMLGRITGLAFAPVAACSTFGVSLQLAMAAIHAGEAKAVVVGATDPPPHPLVVGGFYRARVISADGRVSKPLAGLRGTHIAGGAVLWIVGDLEHMRERGFRPLGMEPMGVGTSSDADHIITPSREGPTAALRQALAAAEVEPDEIGSWDLHATATPGDYQEMLTLRGVLPETVLVTARKGTFGHGMGAAGGWELTAQYLGYTRGKLFPTPLDSDELNAEIGGLHERFVLAEAEAAPPGAVGKLSMGVGGINACVVSRPWEEAATREDD